MFRNMKIAARLGLGFGLLVLIMLAIAVVGSLGMSHLNDSTDDIIANKWPKVLLLQEGLAGVNDIGLAGRNMMLAENKEAAQKAKEQIFEGRAAIGKAWDKLKPTLDQPRGKEMFAQIVDSRERFIAAQNQLIKLAEDGKMAEGRAFLAGDYRSIAQEYRKRVNALVQFQGELMTQSGVAATTEFHQSRNIMIAASVAALLLSVALGFWLARGISRPIGNAVAVANQLAAGDLGVKIEVDSRDETGQLLAAMKNMSGRLAQVITETQAVVGAAAQGDLSRRVDLGDKQGFARDLGSSVNQYSETCDTILSEVGRVLNAMSAGDLKQRIERDFPGAFAEMRTAANSTADTCAAIMAEVGQVMGAVAAGDLTRSIERPFPGDFEAIKNSVNTSIGRLAQTVSAVSGGVSEITAALGQVNAASQTLAQGASEQA
ncbi:MAG: hypothetical protein A2045_10715, partial [Rhodocyclales bacterium GWA2_65_20]